MDINLLHFRAEIPVDRTFAQVMQHQASLFLRLKNVLYIFSRECQFSLQNLWEKKIEKILKSLSHSQEKMFGWPLNLVPLCIKNVYFIKYYYIINSKMCFSSEMISFLKQNLNWMRIWIRVSMRLYILTPWSCDHNWPELYIGSNGSSWSRDKLTGLFNSGIFVCFPSG